MPLSPSRRYTIFVRDGFRCVYCGRAAEDDVYLHVDHIVPRAAGGTDDDENLVTACQECNAGKSDRHPDGSPRVRGTRPRPTPVKPKRRPRLVVKDERPVTIGSFCWVPLGVAALAYGYGDTYTTTLRDLEARGFPTPAGPRDNKAAMERVRQDPEPLVRRITQPAERAIFG